MKIFYLKLPKVQSIEILETNCGLYAEYVLLASLVFTSDGFSIKIKVEAWTNLENFFSSENSILKFHFGHEVPKKIVWVSEWNFLSEICWATFFEWNFWVKLFKWNFLSEIFWVKFFAWNLLREIFQWSFLNEIV